MSTSTPNLIAPPPPGAPPAETAPSQTYDEGQAFGRMVGFAGLFGLVLGGVVIITNQALTPRWIGSGWGFLIAATGVVLMLYHATKDGEQEVRRLYGMLAAAFLVLGVGASVLKGPIFSSAATKTFGYNILPWGVTFGALSLVFAIPFVRHETDRRYRDAAILAMLGVGALLAIGSIVVGLAKPDTLVGPGVALALLGLAFLCAYMTQVDTSEGIGFQVAFLLGAVGAAVAAWAFARSAFPPVLVEGPNAIRKVTGEIDLWKLIPRLVSIAIFLGVAVLAYRAKTLQGWVRAAIIAAGLGAAALFALASVKANLISTSPAPYLVPTGVLLMGLGLLYLGVALAICSDNQFVTLTRRELAAFFLSPVGFLVIAGMAAIEWLGYVFFIAEVQAVSRIRPMDEPIVSQYFVALIPVIGLLLEVPALTMRLVAEEKRTGSLEVLMTAPVNEWPVIGSKFLATWLFFMLTWVPCGLYLIALRAEGGVPFDYRPMLSFYIALGAQGLAFVGLGLLFSTLTRNQIIAAVLTFAVMILFLATYLVRFQAIPFVPPLLQTLLGKLSFIHMWQESLGGRLPLRDVLVFASIGVFSLFLSVKVLEARKWS
ncbi:MAG TPA: ABC transporter permease [Urbifossiella sp.]|nr:ABC transporter permease [Urbifossiella sp.]